MISPTEENYLKTLLHLESKTGEATANELSKLLNIKMPTVNSMIKKLAEKNFVRYESYKPITLTDEGRKQAALILRKHRLIEMFLYETMQLGWEEVHEIAEQIEHIKSLVFFEKLDELLNYPTIDPHGSPIPDKNGYIKPISSIKLSDCNETDTVIIVGILESNSELLQYLSKRDITLGTILEITNIEPFDGCITVCYGDRENQVLSNIVSEKLLVSQNLENE